MNITKSLLITSLLFTSSIALAEPVSYFGAQLAVGKYTEPGFPVANPTMLVLRGGSLINKNFSLEGRFGFGLTEGEVTSSGIPITIEVNNMMGIYALGHLPMNNDLSIYGVLGYTSGELTAAAPGTGITITDSDSGMSFGIGADLAISKTMAINVEYMSYIEEETYDFSALAVGFTGRF